MYSTITKCIINPYMLFCVNHTLSLCHMEIIPPSGHFDLWYIPGQATKRLKGKGGKINTSQAEPVAANSGAVGQFLSISCEALI